MSRMLRLACLALGLGLAPVLAAGPLPDIAIKNVQAPAPDLLTGGQPEREALKVLKAAGYRMVVNLRPDGEFRDFDEAAEVRALGMDYVTIPVAGGEDLTPARAEALDAALKRAGKGPVLVHCASGNRVGALFALRAKLVEQRPGAEALAIGKAHGLTKLEPRVRELLGLPAGESPAEPATGR